MKIKFLPPKFEGNIIFEFSAARHFALHLQANSMHGMQNDTMATSGPRLLQLILLMIWIWHFALRLVYDICAVKIMNVTTSIVSIIYSLLMILNLLDAFNTDLSLRGILSRFNIGLQSV